MDYFILHIHIFVYATNSFLQVNTYENFCITSNEGVKKNDFEPMKLSESFFSTEDYLSPHSLLPHVEILFPKFTKLDLSVSLSSQTKKVTLTKVGYLPNQVPFLLRSHPIFSLYLRSAPSCAPQINSTTKTHT